VGDHGCEYMTKGVVAVLGRAGRNFAAGMSGGIAYVYDERGDFHDKSCNLASVDLEPVVHGDDVRTLKSMIEEHVRRTGSARGAQILSSWETELPRFVKVYPHELKRVLGVERSATVYSGMRQKRAAAAVEVQHG
jgi:glutamate synthase domain-containing protein 3